MNIKVTEIIYTEPESDTLTSAALNTFWFGFILYTIFGAFPGLEISLKYFQVVQIVGIVFFIPSAYYLIRWNFENVYLKVIFLIYILWSFLTIFRGFQLDSDSLKSEFFDSQLSIFIYFAPLILLFRNPLANLKKVFTVIIILNVFFLLYVIIYRKIILYGTAGFFRIPTGLTEGFSHFLGIPSAFIVLTYIYHSKKRIFFTLFILILIFIIVTIRARRALMFMTICFLVFSYIIYYFTNKEKFLKVLLSIALLCLVVLYAFITYTKNQSGMFTLITKRIDEDTRKSVEVYFFNNMTKRDLIFGKGINGSYYCPDIDEVEGSITVFRSVIETGYLQIVLKGGYISLLLYLLITIPAIFKGLFSSRNILSKACAIWIFLFTLFLYPTYVNMFSMTYLIIWVSVGICYNDSFRRLTDEELEILLKYNSK